MAENYNQITKAIDWQTKAICKQLHQEFGLLRESLNPANRADANEKAILIIEAVEDYLDEKEIYIPNPEKSQSEDPGNIYGTEYGDLKEQIIQILMED